MQVSSFSTFVSAALLGKRSPLPRQEPVEPIGQELPNRQTNRQQITHQQDIRLQADIRDFVAEAGTNAQISVTYRYAVGADGQLRVVGAELQSSERVITDGKGRVQTTVPYGSIAGLDATSQPLSRLSSDALAALQEQDASDSEFLRRLQARDAAVRLHEGLHYRTAGGQAADGPEYTFVRGPDGQYYAVGGDVDVATSATSDPAKAARDALTVQLAANAPGDASAADLGVARGSAYSSAGIYPASKQQAAQPSFSMAA